MYCVAAAHVRACVPAVSVHVSAHVFLCCCWPPRHLPWSPTTSLLSRPGRVSPTWPPRAGSAFSQGQSCGVSETRGPPRAGFAQRSWEQSGAPPGSPRWGPSHSETWDSGKFLVSPLILPVEIGLDWGEDLPETLSMQVAGPGLWDLSDPLWLLHLPRSQPNP